MYDTLPTVRIKADTRRGYRIINASAFDAASHTIYEDGHAVRETQAQAETQATSGTVTFAKGPRGKWYVHFDGERQSPGYDTEDAARAAMEP
jgi:hypothetical protein